jgi:hypothetical protein
MSQEATRSICRKKGMSILSNRMREEINTLYAASRKLLNNVGLEGNHAEFSVAWQDTDDSQA